MYLLTYFENPSLFGGSLLPETEESQFGKVDSFAEEVGIASNFISATPPLNKAIEESFFATDKDIPSAALGWLADDVNTLETLVDTDFLAYCPCSLVVDQPSDRKRKISQPCSPAGSFDSGVASPGSAVSGEFSSHSEAFSLPSGVDVLENRLTLPEIPETAFLEEYDEDSNNLLRQLGICDLLVDTTSTTETSNQGLEKRFTGTLKTNKDPEFEFVICHSASNTSAPASDILQLSVVNTVDVLGKEHPKKAENSFPTWSDVRASAAATPLVMTLPKLKCGRKRRTSCAEEQVQRKRKQNRLAATRYRERKREHSMEKESEFMKHDSKNSLMRDEAKKLSGELDCLKKLMLEIYSVKK